MITTFGRSELARIIGEPLAKLNNDIHRDLHPSLIGDRKRPRLTPFDALMSMTASMFTDHGGLDRSLVARVMLGQQDDFLAAARRLDTSPQDDLFAAIALLLDNKFYCHVGDFDELAKYFRKVRPSPIRVCYVNLELAAVLVRDFAREHGIDLGDPIKYGLTTKQLNELYDKR
jgi:hypothetical protein